MEKRNDINPNTGINKYGNVKFADNVNKNIRSIQRNISVLLGIIFTCQKIMTNTLKLTGKQFQTESLKHGKKKFHLKDQLTQNTSKFFYFFSL